MDILQVYREHGVHYQTEGDRHTTRGWINTACPFCVGSPGLHLGFNLESSFFTCWRCGFHDAVETLSLLCRVDRQTARGLYNSIRAAKGEVWVRKKVIPKVRISRYTRPLFTQEMSRIHHSYLVKRNFDPEMLAREWGVLGTGPASFLDEIDYRYRLFVPIYWEGREVSFQTRDVTNKQQVKYKACPIPREEIHHKHILYGHPKGWPTRTGIAVEGITDCWRLGSNAFAVLGIQYKMEQVLQIAKKFDKVAIVFDPEKEAQVQAEQLRIQLSQVDVNCHIFELQDTDPGDMSTDDARHLVREIMRWGQVV